MIKPLRVVDDADQRLFRAGVREETQRGQAHKEPVRRSPGALTERGGERVSLRPGKMVQTGEQWDTELV
jgi:hypothetical protein